MYPATGAWKLEGPTMSKIAELIEYYTNLGEPITARSGAILKHAVPRADWMIQNDEVLIAMKIGKGNFGEVYRGSVHSSHIYSYKFPSRIIRILYMHEFLFSCAAIRHLSWHRSRYQVVSWRNQRGTKEEVPPGRKALTQLRSSKHCQTYR